MRLALDVDGCLANFNEAFRQRLALVTNRPDPRPDWEPTLWDYPAVLGYGPKDTVDAWDSIKVDSRFWANLPAYPGTRTFLEWLWKAVSTSNWTQGTSHEVLFLTDRTGLRAKDQTEDWLHRHGFSGKHPTVLLCNHGKGEVLQALSVTHFLDDRPENIMAAQRYAHKCEPFLLDRAWNREVSLSVAPRRIRSLKDFQRRLSSEF